MAEPDVKQELMGGNNVEEELNSTQAEEQVQAPTQAQAESIDLDELEGRFPSKTMFSCSTNA